MSVAPETLRQAEDPRNDRKRSCSLQLTAHCTQAWQLPVAVALLQGQARLHDLRDVEGVFIKVTVEVGGHATPGQVEALRLKLAELDLGELLVIRESALGHA